MIPILLPDQSPRPQPPTSPRQKADELLTLALLSLLSSCGCCVALAHLGSGIQAECRAMKFVLENGNRVPQLPVLPQLPVGGSVRCPQPATHGAVEPPAVRRLAL